MINGENKVIPRSKVLIVDDDEDVRKLMMMRLGRFIPPSELLESDNPIHAIDVFHEHKKDIAFVICDYYMPRENGLELCKLIKAQGPHIKIYMVSADPNLKMTVGDEEIKAYIDGLFIKPKGLKEVDEEIRQLQIERAEKFMQEQDKYEGEGTV